MNPLAPVLGHAVGVRARRLSRRLDTGLPREDPAVARAEQLRAVGAAAAVDIVPGEQFRADLRTRLLAVAAVQAASAESAPTAAAAVSWRQSSRAGGALVAALASVAVVGGAAVAGSQSLPGDAFYGVKRTQEALQLKLAGSDDARGLRHLAQATARLEELQELAGVPAAAGAAGSQGGLAAGAALGAPVAERVRDTLDDMDADTLRGQALLTAAFDASRDQDRLRLLERWATGQSQGLELLVPSLPSSTRDRARESLSVVVAVSADTGRLLKTPPGCRLPCDPAASPGATPRPSAEPGGSAGPGPAASPRASQDPAAPQVDPSPPLTSPPPAGPQVPTPAPGGRQVPETQAPAPPDRQAPPKSERAQDERDRVKEQRKAEQRKKKAKQGKQPSVRPAPRPLPLPVPVPVPVPEPSLEPRPELPSAVPTLQPLPLEATPPGGFARDSVRRPARTAPGSPWARGGAH